MGLFINNLDHPRVFKNQESIHEPNQAYFKIDYVSELVKRQEEVNEKLLHAFYGLQSNYQQQTYTARNRWEAMDGQVKKLGDSHLRQEELSENTVASQHRLEQQVTNLHDILVKEAGFQQETLKEINRMQAANEGLENKLTVQETLHQQLAGQMAEVYGLQKQMTDQAATQEEKQEDMLKRLEDQEAVMEKITRQLAHFRSIIFERTNHVVEKVENSYDLTSTFFYKMLTGSEQPLTLLMMKEKKEESKQESE